MMRAFMMAAVVLALRGAARAGDWGEFRGGTAGVVPVGTPAPSGWDAQWSVRVPGYGWSSPVVAKGRVFVTTAVSERPVAPKLKGPGGGEKEPPAETFRYEVHCIDAATGKPLWTRVAGTRRPPIANHVSNTFASETPVTDGERVYAYFGMVGVFCYDVDGELLWSRDLGAFRMFANWGSSSSPTQDERRVFVQCDNEERSFVVALDKRTGAEVWRASRPEKSTWGSPVLWRNEVRAELVLMGARRVRSYDPATGAVLWEMTTQEGGGRPAGAGAGGGKQAAGGAKSTPAFSSEMIYLAMAPKVTGQQLGPAWAVRAGASGDISLKAGETSNAGVAWSRRDAGSHFASSVAYDGLLYVVPPHDGVLRVFDAATGADVYQKRLEGAGDFKASMWAMDGKVFAIDERGVTFVVKAGRTFELVGRHDVGDSVWATPAVGGGWAIVRGVERLTCVGGR